MLSDKEAIEKIHKLLDAQEWGVHTLEQVADIVSDTGRKIRDCNFSENFEAMSSGLH